MAKQNRKFKLYNPAKDEYIYCADEAHRERVLKFQEKSGSKTRLLREKPSQADETSTGTDQKEG